MATNPSKKRNSAALEIRAPESLLVGLEQASALSGISEREIRRAMALELAEKIREWAKTMSPAQTAKQILADRSRAMTESLTKGAEEVNVS